MLRMGKNPEEKSPAQADPDHSTRSYSPYQNNEAYRPTPDAAGTPKALTESETIAREITRLCHTMSVFHHTMTIFHRKMTVFRHTMTDFSHKMPIFSPQ